MLMDVELLNKLCFKISTPNHRRIIIIITINTYGTNAKKKSKT